MSPDLHPDIGPLHCLVGTWRGSGVGDYPTIDPFAYTEEVVFTHVGKPFLAYSQRTRDRDSGLPLHAETGYWRLIHGTDLEVVIAHPTGLLELLVGQLESEGVFELRSTSVQGTPTAKEVTAVHRRFELEGDELRYRLAMTAVGQPMTHHLEATLRRADQA